jgi:hypothetical protein
MSACTSPGPNAVELVLANGASIRMILTVRGVVGELRRGGACLTRARFLNFAAAGRWIDAELRVAVIAEHSTKRHINEDAA